MLSVMAKMYCCYNNGVHKRSRSLLIRENFAEIAKGFKELGFRIFSTEGPQKYFIENRIEANVVLKVKDTLNVQKQ